MERNLKLRQMARRLAIETSHRAASAASTIMVRTSRWRASASTYGPNQREKWVDDD